MFLPCHQHRDVPSGFSSGITEQELAEDAVLEHLNHGDAQRVQEIKVVQLVSLRVPFRHCNPGIFPVSSVRVGVGLDVAVDELNDNRHVFRSSWEEERRVAPDGRSPIA